jgi:hypothetical protein
MMVKFVSDMMSYNVPQSWSGGNGEEKNSQLLLGLELLIIQPVSHCYTTELFWPLDSSGRNILLNLLMTNRIEL